MVWGEGREEGSGWGACVYLKLKKRKKKKRKEKKKIKKKYIKCSILVNIWQLHCLLPLAREENKYNSCKSKVLIYFKSFNIVHIILHSNSSSGNLL